MRNYVATPIKKSFELNEKFVIISQDDRERVNWGGLL